jgi:hypothetical protein
VTVAAVVLLALGCTGDSSAPAAPAPASPGPPAPPAGMRWQGVGDVVVAVPSSWGTVTEPCATGAGPAVHYVLPQPVSYRCAETRDPSGLRITPGDGPGAAGRPACRQSATQSCTLTFARAGAGSFVVTYRGAESEAFVRAVRGSATRLPTGWTTVPVFAYGTSVVEAEELLERAGLVGEAPDIDYPHYATGTDPVPGSAVPDGATVAIEIGDG